MFPAYGMKCLSRKAVHSWVENRGKFSLMKKLGQQSNDFYAEGFDALVNRRDKCINVGGGYVEN
jgi:hypothetical protein